MSTQVFLNEVFPEYKHSESYFPELLLERIRVLEKKDYENQRVIETMMTTLETMTSTVEKVRDRILYLEKYPMYLNWISEKGYSKDSHIPVKDLVKVFENYSGSCLNAYMYGAWNSWTVYASYEELLILCLDLTNMPSNRIISFCGGSFGIYGGEMKDALINNNGAYSYKVKMEILKKYRSEWLPGSGGYPPPGEDESFVINYFDKVEKILVALKDLKILS